MQILEGNEQNVLALYEQIENDRRHTGLIVLMQEPLAERHFPDWSMAFKDLNSPEVQTMQGYSELLNIPLEDDDLLHDPHQYMVLLKSFIRVCRD